MLITRLGGISLVERCVNMSLTRTVVLTIGSVILVSLLGCSQSDSGRRGQIGQAITPTSARPPSPTTPIVAPSRVCSANELACGGICVDISRDPHQCGRCGVTCARGEICHGGTCQPAAPQDANTSVAVDYRPLQQSRCREDGQTDCGGGCVDIRVQAEHCGRCGNVCPVGSTCVDGECS